MEYYAAIKRTRISASHKIFLVSVQEIFILEQIFALNGTTWMNPEKLMLSEIRGNQKRANTLCFHLYEVPRVIKFIQTESQMVAARRWGEEEGRATI